MSRSDDIEQIEVVRAGRGHVGAERGGRRHQYHY